MTKCLSRIRVSQLVLEETEWLKVSKSSILLILTSLLRLSYNKKINVIVHR